MKQEEEINHQKCLFIIKIYISAVQIQPSTNSLLKCEEFVFQIVQHYIVETICNITRTFLLLLLPCTDFFSVLRGFSETDEKTFPTDSHRLTLYSVCSND